MLFCTVDVAKQSLVVDDVILRLDDLEITSIAREYDYEVLFSRLARLASDNASGMTPVFHASAWLQEHGRHNEHIILLQSTSSLRASFDITDRYESCRRIGVPFCLVVIKNTTPSSMYF